jgi:hypothetical protein
LPDRVIPGRKYGWAVQPDSRVLGVDDHFDVLNCCGERADCPPLQDLTSGTNFPQSASTKTSATFDGAAACSDPPAFGPVFLIDDMDLSAGSALAPPLRPEATATEVPASHLGLNIVCGPAVRF